MPDQVPDGFSWSASRNNLFENCPRAYFFQYYLAVNKAEDADSDRAGRARRLKCLKTIPMWVGSHVHDAAETLLKRARDDRDADADPAIDAMLRQMRQDYKDSKTNRAATRDPRHYARFHEHEYGQDVPDEKWKICVDEAVEMVRTFTGLGYVEQVRALAAEDLLALEDLQRWSFESVPVWVRIDLAFRDADETVHILDWKTGRRIREDNPLQLMGYAAYAEHAWDVVADRLAVREVYLRLEDPEKSCTIDDDELERARGQIRESVDAMIAALADPRHNVAREEAFEALPEPRKCARCFYRGICPSSAA
ncbi:MAG: PD-(D/E)XK nuclease family protein [Acidobacteriota bacterium]|nr:PD-(D/E)XK nuclease family protein [Acidobacteriota bacterium]